MIFAGHGGTVGAVAAEVISVREFVGYWEYMIDQAIFTAPAHPNWGGGAVIDENGKLVAVGSLFVQQSGEGEQPVDGNMAVPIDILKPIFDDMTRTGTAGRVPRPWLGLFGTEIEDRLVIAALSDDGPAEMADCQVGDIIVDVAGQSVDTLGDFFAMCGRWGRPAPPFRSLSIAAVNYSDCPSTQSIETAFCARRRCIDGYLIMAGRRRRPVPGGSAITNPRGANSMNGAESLVRTMVGAGVDVCFTNPGTSEMHFVAALDKVDGMRCVLGLFEGGVTGMADGFARMADKPASTLLHLGPGLANGLANLHNARRAMTPIVNIVGDHTTYHHKYDAPLTADITKYAAPVSHWIKQSRSSKEVAQHGAEAIQAAQTSPGQIAT